MPRPSPAALVAFLLSLACFSQACLHSAPPKPFEVTLYVGIRELANLGDTEEFLRRTTKYRFRRRDIPARRPALSLSQVDVTHFFEFSDLGTRVYFREGRVVLIEMEDPFQGTVQGKDLKLFEFSTLKDKTWEEQLTRLFGGPIARASGGRFGAECLFYPWGDISYNRNGPNEIALYRDPAISRYRQKSFGRDLRLFTN